MVHGRMLNRKFPTKLSLRLCDLPGQCTDIDKIVHGLSIPVGKIGIRLPRTISMSRSSTVEKRSDTEQQRESTKPNDDNSNSTDRDNSDEPTVPSLAHIVTGAEHTIAADFAAHSMHAKQHPNAVHDANHLTPMQSAATRSGTSTPQTRTVAGVNMDDEGAGMKLRIVQPSLSLPQQNDGRPTSQRSIRFPEDELRTRLEAVRREG